MKKEMPEVYLSQASFEALPEYSCTIPTGTYEGKQWKRREPYSSEGPETRWYLGEYVPCDIPGQIGIRWSRIVLEGRAAGLSDMSAATEISAVKTRYPRAAALEVVRELLVVLTPRCERIIVAGSLRRRKESVGDIEIVYIPRLAPAADDNDLFRPPIERNLVDVGLEEMERSFVLRRRLNTLGSESYGPKNKLMLHGLSGIPVDLFAATEANWWNYVVCRTGPAASNTEIAGRALERGYKWNPYGVGFTRSADGEEIPMASERAVFEFVRLAYRAPWER